MAQDLNRHPDEGELEKYSMADLRAEEAAAFEEHLLQCEHCQQRLADADAYVAAMRRAAAQLVQPARPPRQNQDEITIK
jgi:anti-sigma factor RsiW